MQPHTQIVEFDEKVEEFCKANNLSLPNLLNLLLSRNERATNTILNAKIEAIKDNIAFSPERLEKIIDTYNKASSHLETQFSFLSDWSGLTHRNWQTRVYGSQMLMENLLEQDLEIYTAKQQEFQSQDGEMSASETVKQETAMNMIGKGLKDIEIFAIKEGVDATELSHTP